MADLPYGGTDTLEAMVEARRYNAHLARLVGAACRGARDVLDFGAGLGTFARIMRDRGLAPVCLEPDPALAAHLAAQGFRVVGGLDAIAAESLDVIYSLNVLEHIEDDSATLRALAGRLRPGGRLMLYVPAFPILYSPMDRRVGHFRRYRRAPLARLVASAGLELERIGHVDCLGFPASLALRAFGARDGALDPGAVRFYDRFVFPLSRALDPVLGRWFGKNLSLTARRPMAAPAPATTDTAFASPPAARG